MLIAEAEAAPTAAVAVHERPQAGEPEPSSTGTTTVEAVAEVWEAIVDTVSGESSMLGAALHSARPVDLVDGALVIAFPESEMFNRRIAAENAENRRLLGEALRAFTGASLRLAYEIREVEATAAEPPLAGDELVARLVQEFDAEEIVPDPAEESP